MTEDEQAQFNAMKTEVENYDNTIENEEYLAKKFVKVETPKENAENKEEKAFANYIRGIRNGDDITESGDMGAVIPTTIWDRVISKVIEISPILERATKFYLGGTLIIPVEDRANSSLSVAYATEGTAPDAGDVALTQVTLTGFLASALAKVSNSLINNTKFDVVGYVVDKIAQALALWIESELFFGTEDKITGLSTISDAMTVHTSSNSAISTDELIELQDKVVDKYQGNAIWIMNQNTRDYIRKLKVDNKYILEPDFTEKWNYRLLGKPVYVSDAMVDIGAGKLPIFYGDFSGLTVKFAENGEIQILRERYAPEHLTGIVTFVEVDAKLTDTQKIARLCNGATVSM